MTGSRTVSPSVALALGGKKRAKGDGQDGRNQDTVPVAASQRRCTPRRKAWPATTGILATSLSSMGTGMLMMVEGQRAACGEQCLKGLRGSTA